jgi:hypothetical protein
MSLMPRVTIFLGLLLGAVLLLLFHGETAGDSTADLDQAVTHEATRLLEEAQTVHAALLKAVKAASKPDLFLMQQALLRLTAGQAYLEMALDMLESASDRPHGGRPPLAESLHTLQEDVAHARSVLSWVGPIHTDQDEGPEGAAGHTRAAG